LLRVIDREHEHRTDFHSPSDAEILFAPETVLEITRVTDGAPAPTRRFVIGTGRTQVVELL
jgi:hypothetical protein